MTDKLSQAYDSIDKAIMNVVGKGVRAYTWTTGDTKAGLANKMLSVAPILETIAACTLYPRLGVMAGAALFFFSHRCKKNNINMENKEIKAIESNCLDISVEEYKEKAKNMGEFYSSFGFIQSPLAVMPDLREFYSLFCPAQFLRGLSNYIMRTDYQPPKKSFIEKCVDELKDAVRNYQVKPQLQPALTNPKYSLEDLI